MPCPDESRLSALAAGGLEALDSELEAHLDVCPACRAAVVVAAAVDPRPAADPEHEDGLAAGSLTLEEPERYEALGECGRGGQSRVLRVFDRRVGRELALKELVVEGEAARARFLREVRIVGELAHPAVVPIHEVGMRRDGKPYYTMPLIDGRTLADVVEATPAAHDRLRLLPQFVQICRAVAAAHNHGVIHRDIKPANIMLGRFGEALLLDWGLAKFTDATLHTGALDVPAQDMSLTRQGQALGTPAYMSPEQAAGRVEDVDERSDVWSLGAVLHFVLTASPPFSGAGASAVMSAVMEGRRQLADDVRSQLPPELLAVAGRAMEHERERRYASATELADDLVAFASGGRVSAHDYSPRERALRFVRRHRVLFAATTAVFAVLAVALVVVTRSYGREAEQRRRAEDAQAVAEQARGSAEAASQRSLEQSRLALFNLSRAHVEKAERLRAEGKVLEARLYAATSLHENPTHPSHPSFEPSLAESMPDAPTLRARTAALFTRAETDAVRGRIAVTDPLTASEPVEVEHASGEDGLVLVAADGGEEAKLWRPGAEPTVLPGHAGGCADVALSRSGAFVVSRAGDGTLRLWSGAGALLATWSSPAPPMTRVAVSDLGAVAAVNAEGAVTLRDRESGTTRVVGRGPSMALDFSVGGRFLAVGDHEGRGSVVDVGTGREVEHSTAGERGIVHVAFSPDDRRLAVVDTHSLVVVRERGRPDVIASLAGHRGGVTSIAFSPDGARLFTAATDGRVRGFDIESAELLFDIDGPTGHIYELAVDGDTLVAVAAGGVVRWRLGGQAPVAKPVEVLNAFVEEQNSTIFVPHAARPELARIDLVTGHTTWMSLPEVGAARRVVPLPGGEQLVAAHEDGRVIWWARQEDRAVPMVSRHPVSRWPASFAVSVDGRRAAIDGGDGDVLLVSRDDGVPERRLTGQPRTVLWLAFSPDGETLASAGYGGDVVLWRVADGEHLATLDAGGGPVEAVAFAGNDRLVSAGKAGVRTWTGPPWAEERRLSTVSHRAVAVDDEAERVATLADDGRVTVRRLPDGDLLLDIRDRPGPQAITFDQHGALWLVRKRAFERIPIHADPLPPDPAAALAEAEAAAGTSLEHLER